MTVAGVHTSSTATRRLTLSAMCIICCRGYVWNLGLTCSLSIFLYVNTILFFYLRGGLCLPVIVLLIDDKRSTARLVHKYELETVSCRLLDGQLLVTAQDLAQRGRRNVRGRT